MENRIADWMMGAGETLVTVGGSLSFTKGTEGVNHYSRVMANLSGKRTVSGQFPGKLQCSTEGAILKH
jgi:hypothetical protein